VQFYEEMERVLDQFSKYHMKILLEDFNVNHLLGMRVFTSSVMIMRFGVMKFVTSKNMIVKSTTFLRLNIHK
jgi:hypothetical protein